MDIVSRIERALDTAIASTQAPGGPPLLSASLRYAVFPGGARIRPRLCLAVAKACGDAHPEAADAAAASIELLHCASLVHDDLPCFDDAETRRGKLTVHRTFGEPLAVLAGDALIVLAFETLGLGCQLAPHRLAPLLSIIARSVGAPHGIVAGQAWECEKNIVLADYQRAKTGSLFAAATIAGAAAAGADHAAWQALGERLGEAYQVADDLHDISSRAEEVGKPVGRDAVLGRPSAPAQLGIAGAIARLKYLVGAAMDSVPPCPGADQLRQLVEAESRRFLPKELARLAA
jgi:geranylgeranyl diphosphate synthase type II